jgi:dynactin complex subunit
MDSPVAVKSDSVSPPQYEEELKVGDKVYVSTRQAFGILQYMGPIPKKTGNWAGVELEKSGSGKNDGSIEG